MNYFWFNENQFELKQAINGGFQLRFEEQEQTISCQAGYNVKL